MVGLITQSSNLNTFGSICYCFITLGIQAYASYKAITRYKEAGARVWPGLRGDSPIEVSSILGLTIMSLLLMPLFCVASFLKIGNLANDGVKLGRDHEKPTDRQGDQAKKAVETIGQKLRRKGHYLWKHFCPIAQTIHLIAAFLLLLPEVLLTAAEVKFGYKSADVSWESELDFLYPIDRAMKSFLRSSVNVTVELNATYYQIPGKSTPSTGGWGDRISVSIAFVHFCIALACFLIRYASVFWYTNKALTLVFSCQLLAMVVNSIFGFNSFATLYCVCYNKRLYANVRLSLGCQVVLMLYLVSSTILVVSTITVFEYGSHYFHEKSKIVERHHNTDSYVKKTIIVNSGCQGYLPHSCAMAFLVVFAVCRGPIIYDLVLLMRLTSDQLLVSGVICEVCYMVTWVALWFCLTIKQKWQFRLLDYVPLRHLSSLNMSADGSSVKMNRSSDRGDSIDSGSLTRMKRGSALITGHPGAPSSRYADSLGNGTNTPSEDPCQSDLGTDESDTTMDNATAAAVAAGEMVVGGPEMRPQMREQIAADGGSSSLRRSRGRRSNAQRVTFEESIAGPGQLPDSQQMYQSNATNSLPRSSSSQGMTGSGSGSGPGSHEVNHMNVTADVHNVTPPPQVLPLFVEQPPSVDSSQETVIMRRRNSGAQDTTLSKEYRNSIRNKCGDYYSSASNLSSSQEDIRLNTGGACAAAAAAAVPPAEPITTLMSSFRDKVRESSIAASNFKEHMLEHYNGYDEPLPLQSSSGLDGQPDVVADKRKCLGMASNDDAMMLDRDARLVDESANNLSSSSLTRRMPAAPSSTGSEDSQRNSLTNSTIESSDLSLPPLFEDIQLGRVRCASGSGPREDFLVMGGKPSDHHYHQQQQKQQNHIHQQHHPHHAHHQHHHLQPHSSTRPIKVLLGNRKPEMGRRDSANYSLTSSSQDNSSNESDHGGQALCSQV